MSPPLETVLVKRKRTSEHPPEYFHLPRPESRHVDNIVSQDVYILERAVRARAEPSPPVQGAPRLVTTRPGEENGYFERMRSQAASSNANAKTQTQQKILSGATSTPRRFYFSNFARPPPQLSGSVRVKRKAEQELQVAVFVEASDDARAAKLSRVAGNRKVTTKISGDGETREPDDVEMTESRAQFKKPGATASVRKSTALTRSDKPDAGQEELHAKLQMFAEEEEQQEHVRQNQRQEAQATEGDAIMTNADEDDYIYEKYVRQSAVTATTAVAITSPESYGVLVVPEEDEELFWDQYGESWSESDDWDSEQDDENAENWYGADYPEDEVASDDEYDRDAYRYRHRGASDEEEFGSEDDDDDGDYDAARWPSEEHFDM